MIPLRVLEALHSFSVFKMFSLEKELHWFGVMELRGRKERGSSLEL